MAWKVMDGMAVDTVTGEIVSSTRRVRRKPGGRSGSGWYMAAVQQAGKLATSVMPPATEEPPPEATRADPQPPPALFDPGPPPARRRSPLYVCGVQGGFGDWPPGYWEGTVPKRRPVCNRGPNHDGPHRQVRKRDFRVVAEWT